MNILWLLLAACSNDKIELEEELEETVEQAADWCSASLAGEQGTRAFIHDFARMHMGRNLFGPEAQWLQNDADLAALIKTHPSLDSDFLVQYAAQSNDLCAATKQEPLERESSIAMYETTAHIILGQETIDIPEEAEAVVIDLRAASASSPLKEILESVLAEEVVIGQKQTRRFLGFPSQSEDWTHYEVSNAGSPIMLTGTSSKPRDIFFMTPANLHPAHALLIAGLRLHEKAGIAGHHVYAATAEATWSGIEASGILWRAQELWQNGERWPDRIDADIETLNIEEIHNHLTSVSSWSAVSGDATRAAYDEYLRYQGDPSDVLNVEDMKAGLIVTYGVLDWFFPYFDIVGRALDDRIIEEFDTVSALENGDREGFMHALGRVMNSINDGHGFYSDWASTSWPDGYLGVQIQRVNNLPVIRASLHDEIQAGDTIVALEGTDIEDWYEEAMSRYSAASDGYRFVLATDELKEVYGTKQLTLKDTDGNTREETVSGLGWNALSGVPWGGTLRESGWLEDLNAGDIFYVNMAGNVTPEMAPVTNQFADVMGASGVILDMRDYPYLEVYEFTRHFKKQAYSAPLFGFPTWTGPDSYELVFDNWEFSPETMVYEGPIVLIVSNKSVSAAELFSQMITEEDNVTVVGQQSASTNGTITQAWLPGQIQITFTGMDLRNTDGSDFHGIGIVPDVEVFPTPQQFADGIDPELMQSIDVLQAQ